MAGPVSDEYIGKQAVPEIEKTTEARPAEWETERNDKNPLSPNCPLERAMNYFSMDTKDYF